MKTKLIKAYNEIYFRKFQDTDLLPVKSDIDANLLHTILTLSEDYEVEMFCILHDLFEIMFGTFKNSFIPLSKVAGEILRNERKLEIKFVENFRPTFISDNVAMILAELSSESYYVGGCVRDACRGTVAKDIDFCTDTPMNILIEMFKRKGYKCDEVGLQFLVLVVSMTNEEGIREEFEIANFRKDNYSKKPKYVRRIK